MSTPCIVIAQSGSDATSEGHSEEIFKKNTIYGEFLGHALYFLSINYDRILYHDDINNITLSLGGQKIPLLKRLKSLSYSGSINFFTPLRDSWYIEFGLGYGEALQERYNPQPDEQKKLLTRYLLGRAGLRFQQPEGGLMLRIYFSPYQQLYSEWPEDDWDGEEYEFWNVKKLGISVGYTF